MILIVNFVYKESLTFLCYLNFSLLKYKCCFKVISDIFTGLIFDTKNFFEAAFKLVLHTFIKLYSTFDDIVGRKGASIYL